MNSFETNSKFINGLPLIESAAITVRAQKRKHKKRRINKKWLKRFGYHEVPDPSIYLFKDPYNRNSKHIAGHPVTLKRVIAAIEKQKEST